MIRSTLQHFVNMVINPSKTKEREEEKEESGGR
jgi:hypothetical protein